MKYLFFLVYLLFPLSIVAQNGTKIPRYIKPLFDFDKNKPLFNYTADQKINVNRLLRYYSLSGYREGVEPFVGQFNTTFGVTVDKIAHTRRIFMYNVSLQEMLIGFYDKDAEVLLEVKDPRMYRYLPEYGDKLEWMHKYAKCFEITMPEGALAGRTLDKIKGEILNLRFGYRSKKIKTLVLSTIPVDSKIKTTDKVRNGYQGLIAKHNNISIDSLSRILKSFKAPFKSEATYEGAIDILVDATHKTLPFLNMQLKRYGLALREEWIDTPLFIITEPEYQENNEK